MSLVAGKAGISKRELLGTTASSQRAAEILRQFVRGALDAHLPKSLAQELNVRDFDLRLKPSENALANDIIDAFEPLSRITLLTSSGDLVDVDILNEVFGKFLVDSFLDEKELGQYLTPPEVVRFMVALAISHLAPEDRDLLSDQKTCSRFGFVLDPSCGVGSFLTGFLRSLRPESSAPKAVRLWTNRMVRDVMVGIDKSERMIRLALTNMAMFGIPPAKLHLANALARSGTDGEAAQSLDGRVGLILTNPPFGAEFSGRDLLKYRLATKWVPRPPRKIDSELLFVERYVDWLKPGGQFLAIVPDSVLTNRGLFADLRRGLAGAVDLCTVISLPEVTFAAAGTSTKTSILHIRKKDPRHPSTRPTYFGVCQNIGYSVATRDAQRTKVRDGDGDLPQLLREAASQQVDRTLGRLVPDAANGERWDANHHASLAATIQDRLGALSSSDVLLSDVAELTSDRVDPRRWGGGTFQYIEISDVDSDTCMVRTKPVPCAEAPSRARRVAKANDVLYSTVRPERRTVGVVRSDQDGAVCTTGFAVLRPHGIPALVLAHLLKTDFVTAQVLRHNVGIAYPAVDESCLSNLLLPIRREDLVLLEPESRQLADFEQGLNGARQKFSERLAHVMETWSHSSVTSASRPRRGNRTTGRLQSRTLDSDARAQDSLSLWEGHTS